MEYVYDIVLNFHKEYYEFYEWNIKDKIVNIKKIPIYKISTKDYLSIKNNKVVIIKESLPKKNNMFLLTNGFEILGVILNKKGIVIKKSSLIFEESDDILEDKNKINLIKIKYKIIKNNDNYLNTRIRSEKERYIKSYFKNINKKDDEYLLKYLYYNIYNIEENNIDIIYNKLKLLSKNDLNLLYDNIKKVNLELNRI